MARKYEIIDLRERPDLAETAAAWFHEKWGVPAEAYRASMAGAGGSPVPRWYVALEGGIIGGVGAIENDFHDRTDLAPNVCALYVEEAHRGRGLAGALLDRVCGDLRDAGIDTVYLVTDHTSLYERYGWEFLCLARGEDGESLRMYVHRAAAPKRFIEMDVENHRTNVANSLAL